MKRLKVFYFCISIAVLFTFGGCSMAGTGYNSKEIQKFINSDIKALGNLPEGFVLTGEDRRIVYDGVDEDYKELNGYMDILNIYSIEGGKETILYNVDFKSGNFRLVLVKPGGEAVDIVKKNGEGSAEVEVPSGKSIIKLIGSNATGKLMLSIPTTTVEDIKKLGKIDQDGEFIFPKDNGTRGDNLSIILYHIKVANKKIDKIAKVELKGKIESGKAAAAFNNDGWGNSGTAEVTLGPNGKGITSIAVTIKDKTFSAAEWGIKEGTFTPINQELPDFLKGL